MTIVVVALVTFVLLDALVFVMPVYRHVLAPQSTAGSFERAIARVAADSANAERSVLVLGDSRIFNGFESARANARAPALHFVNAAIPGTTPRCWTIFDRIVDPDARRYRAVVIPVDTYADEDDAIGSIDGNERAFDLRYIGLRTNARETLAVATSFTSPATKVQALVSLALRGPLVREDVQDFVRDPHARIEALRAAAPFDLPTVRTESLAHLSLDFARDVVVAPASYTPAQRRELERQLFLRPSPSLSYARYRTQWLGALVERYARTGVPVIFVRIPTRPAHRTLPAPPSGSLVALMHEHARLLPQEPYVALERPAYFADADHLNAAGAGYFSDRLARDVVRALADPAYGTRPDRPIAPMPSGRDPSPPAPLATAPHHRFGPVLASLARAARIGTPLEFQSVEFVLFFALLALLFYVQRGPRARKIVLLAASWYFYARWNAWYLAVIVALSATDYAFGRGIARSTGTARRVMLSLGVCTNLAFLGTAKYADFATQTLATLLHVPGDPWALHVLVPVGISFHTFQSISYLVDVSRDKARVVRDPIDYALYLAFFPQLLAGPIVRAARFFGELWGWHRPTAAAVMHGLAEIGLGLIKKGVVADRFAPVADSYFGNIAAHPGAPAAWCGALAFAVQIYFDFSGYSDIAIGCARVLGFAFPENFRRPYLAWSVTEFWRRWHMTLSAWLRDYLYIPLGGSRGGTLLTLRNLMLTMLLGGLWHGANWTFVAWGAYHGALLACERLCDIGRTRVPPAGFRRIAATLLTFALVTIGWVLFRAQSFADAATVLRAMFAGGAGPALFDIGQIAIVVLAIGLEIVVERRPQLRPFVTARARFAAAVAGLVALAFATYPGAAAPFVYFKF